MSKIKLGSGRILRNKKQTIGSRSLTFKKIEDPKVS